MLALTGILCGLALGGLLVLLFRRRDDQLPGPSGALGLGADDDGGLSMISDRGTDIQFFNYDPRPKKQRRQKMTPLQRVTAQRNVPVARTVTVSNGKPTHILQASSPCDWSAWVRTVGPPGAFATFMISDNPGDAIDVPAGQMQKMRIPSGEHLYAKGDMPNVRVSVSAGEEL